MSVENNTYNIQEVGLAKALIRRGHKCDILFWTNHNEETIEIPVSKSDGKKLTVYYKRGITVLKNTIYVNCKDLFDRYDILQPCEYNQMEAWLISIIYPQKAVIYHGPYYSTFNKRYNLMCKFFDFFFLWHYKKDDTQFIVKSKLAKYFLESKGISNIDISGVGIDTEMLNTKELTCKEPLYVTMSKDKGRKLLYIGRFEERRNIVFILDILKLVKQKHENVTLYMVGTGEAEYMSKVWRYAKDIGVDDIIVWQERIEQKYLSYIYTMSDFFLLPTEYEIFGMVLLEAMYYRNIVITTSNGGSSTLITNGKNGIIDDSKNPDSWANKIYDYINNQRKMTIMKDDASNTIKAGYTWDDLANIFERCYERKIKNRNVNESIAC